MARAPLRRSLGIALVITLIALAMLMIASVAMVASLQTTSVLAGNLSFRRDLVNQAERGVARARQTLAGGALASEAQREQNATRLRYSAQRLDTNSSGIPLLLLSNKAFAAQGMSADDDIVGNGVAVRWVIDRQCTSVGPVDAAACEGISSAADSGGSSWLRKPGGELAAVYRISVRASGPRDTLAFIQATFAF